MKKILVILLSLILSCSFVFADDMTCKTENIENAFNLIYSPYGKSCAYIKKENNKYFVVKDWIEGKKYDGIYDLTYSPDSKSLSYTVYENNKWFVVKDWIEGKKYDSISTTKIYSPDSKSLSYGVYENNKWFVVKDWIEEKKYDSISAILRYSPDSKSLSYGAKEDNKRFVVKDWIEGKKYDGIYDLTYSPDSKSLSYTVYENNKYFIIKETCSAEKKQEENNSSNEGNIQSKKNLIKNLILAKAKLKTSPYKKYQDQIDTLIPNLSDKKLLKLQEKLKNINAKGTKYEDIINYIEAKVGLEILVRQED